MENMQWKISVPIFRNTIILKQLGVAIGIPFGLVVMIIGFTSEESHYTLYALGLIVGLFVLTWLLIMVVYQGKYEVEFVLNGDGILYQTQAEQRKKNRFINTLTVLLGLFFGKPATAGAGMLAQSRQEVFLRWNRITWVKYRPLSHTILLGGGLTEHIALFCTAENYKLVERFVIKKVQLEEEVRHR